MKTGPKTIILRIFNTLAFGAMITANYAANSLPLWWKTTGQISDIYAGFFVPAGYTFVIWWLIYFLLAGFIFFQLYDLFFKRHEKSIAEFIDKKSGWFILSCAANIAWIFSWHHEYIGLSLLSMTTLFLSLSFIYGKLGSYESHLHPRRFTLFFLLPFRIYFSWISVAIFLNISSYLSFLWFFQTSIAQMYVFLVLLIFSSFFQIYVTKFFRDSIFWLVWLWAIFWIFIRVIGITPWDISFYALSLMLAFSFLSYIIWTINKPAK